MPFIPAPTGTVRVVVNQSLKGQDVINVLHYEKRVGGDPSTPTTGDLEDFLESFSADWQAGPLSFQNIDLTLVDITATAVEEEAGAYAVESLGVPGAGGAVADPLANSLAVVVSWRTASAGRNARGRTYLAGITDSLLVADDNNRITPTAASDLRTAMETLMVIETGGLPSTDYHLSVASYYDGVDVNHKPIPRAEAVLFDVTGAVVRPLLGNQRRRRPSA